MVIMLIVVFGLICMVMYLCTPPKCKSCGCRKSSQYVPENYMDLKFMGYYCNDCDKDEIDELDKMAHNEIR